ncbi:MAG: SRPBCC family protein [Bacteroidota bacterium]|nr:SRPBCC family protein [Bacteroidota bacterium]MDX5448836.1 SRPBCC family protein [Bacteroidota bacterium]MDX5506826.1 SRPBCC family protein [Bacteroidota bacterium]
MPKLEPITIKTKVKQPIEKVWHTWISPEHIVNWNFASPEWHCPRAENNLIPGGRFSCRMEARDGSMGFDLSGQYDSVEAPHRLQYHLDDGRKVSLDLFEENGVTLITQIFEPESSNPIELQRDGWQAILNNFSKYTSQLDR